MRDKIYKLLKEIKAEAMQEAIDSLAANMVESASGMWEAIKQYCGEKEAALAVMCLLQKAVEDGVIVATKFANPADDDDATTVTLRMTAYDETEMMIEGTDGICIEVAKR